MGTFLDYYGNIKINKDKLNEYINRVQEILKYGGIVQFDKVRLFEKEISLISTPQANKDGKIFFHYNIFGDEAWETACFDINNGEFYTNKVGWAEFNWICSAIYILTEFYSDSFMLANENGELYDASEIIGWLNYLFDEKYTNKRYQDLWKVYENVYNKENADVMDLFKNSENIENTISLTSFISYIYISNNSLWDTILNSYNEEKKEGFNLIGFITTTYNWVKKMKEQEKSYEELLELLFIDNETLKENIKNDKFEYKHISFFLFFTPSNIVLKQLCEIYKKDFWEEYNKYKNKLRKLDEELWDQNKKDIIPIEKVKTSKFLDMPDSSLCFWRTEFPENYHKSDDDFCYFWKKDCDLCFSNEFKDWCNKLKNDFDTIKTTDTALDEIDYIKELIDLLDEANSYYERIFAYQEMFYDFISHSKSIEYQAFLKLFKKVIDDNKDLGAVINTRSSDWDITDRNITFNKGRLNIKRFLAIMANTELRKEIFKA